MRMAVLRAKAENAKHKYRDSNSDNITLYRFSPEKKGNTKHKRKKQYL